MKTETTMQLGSYVNRRMKSLFVAQDDRPANLKAVHLSQLTPYQRGLLVTDGTVTRFIEAYTSLPVEVARLAQRRETLTADHPWLALDAGAEVISRQVVLQTHSQDDEVPIIHTYADSLIVLDRLPATILEGLDTHQRGLGGLLRLSGLENWRELLWCGVEVLNDLPAAISHLEGERFISRTYRVYANGEPLMLINEKFPL